MPHINLKKVIQLGIVVEDAEKTAANYQKIFKIADDAMMRLDTRQMEDWQNQTYKDRPVTFELRIILFNYRGIQFELIEPTGGDDNCYSDFLRKNGPGIQHIFIHMDDHNKTSSKLVEEGVPVLTSGHMLGADYKYFDFSKQLGLILETADLPDSYVQSIIDS